MATARPQLLLAALVVGLAAGPYLPRGCGWVVVLLVPLLVIAVTAFERRVAAGLLAAALAVGGLVAGQARVAAMDAVPAAVERSGEFSGTAYLVERFRRSGTGMRARVRVNGGPAQGARLEVRLRTGWGDTAGAGDGDTFEYKLGEELVVEGHIRPLRAVLAAGTGGAGYRRWLRSEGVDAVLLANAVRPTGRRRGGVAGLFDGIRVRAERALAAGIPQQPAALMRGMVLGGDEQFAPQLQDDFRAVGLSHIVAVSGANVMLLAVLVAAVCGALGVGFRARFWLALACIGIYVPLCGAGASVVRAGVMGVAALCAVHLARGVSRAYTLLLAALALLLLNPRAPEDVGAQLSFAAVLGLMAFAAPLQHGLRGRFGWPSWLAEAAAATAAATIATTPVSAFQFGHVSLIALPANVLAAPVIGPIVWIGSVVALAGQIAVWPAALLNALAGFMLAYLIELSHALAGVPGAQVGLAMGMWGLVASSLFLVLGAFAVHRGGVSRLRELRLLERVREALPRRLPGMSGAAAGAVSVLALAVVAWQVPQSASAPPHRPAIVFFDVGQGDSQLLLGSNGCEVLIDGGPRGSGIAGRLERLGVHRLELVVATHSAADHHGGLLDALEAGRLQVDHFIAGGLPSTDRSYGELIERMRAQGASIGEAAAGASWRCGDLALNVLGPAPSRPGQRPPDEPNTRAAVVEATVGATTLLTSGDAESPQLLPLPLGHVDVLKVSHHGSEDEGVARVLDRLRPQVAVIQVGAHNAYGHPRAEVLSALAGVPTVKRTDRDGTVVVQASPGPPR